MTNEKTQHTSEPWVANDNLLFQENGFYQKYIGSMGSRDNLPPIDAANAARIVACVNACKGLSSEQLATLPQIIDEGTIAIQERAELLNVLEFAHKQFSKFESAHGTSDCEAAFRMRGIIESYKSKTDESTT